MGNTITPESFDSLFSFWNESDQRLNWSPVFILPVWLKVWWQVFGDEAEIYLNAVKQDDEVIGIAPLKVKEGKASFIGSADVCDYLDFIIAPGMEPVFFSVLLDNLKQNNISHLDLESLRPDSTVLTSLVDIARNRGYRVSSRQVDVSLELELPATWEDYLALLNAKQRHEVRRKLRRLEEAGRVEYRFVSDVAGVRDSMDAFLKMFTESREDKADFLDERRESFFRLMADAMAEAGLLKLGILDIDSVPAAMIIYFDYNNCIYLYNSGYEPRYNSLSAGLMSKVLCIRESIENGRSKFDFLKGDEIYKYRLGGSEVPVYNCQITIE